MVKRELKLSSHPVLLAAEVNFEGQKEINAGWKVFLSQQLKFTFKLFCEPSQGPTTQSLTGRRSGQRLLGADKVFTIWYFRRLIGGSKWWWRFFWLEAENDTKINDEISR